MASYSELERGKIIVINDQPYEITEAISTFKGRGHSYLQMKLKNLVSGVVISRSAQPRDSFEDADIDKMDAKFIYASKDKCVFTELDNPSKRFEIDTAKIGDGYRYLKEGETVTTVIFDDEVINVIIPIKVKLKVTEVPPGIKGDRAQSGNKMVKVETGLQINAPLFVEEGDVIEINTESGDYVRRVTE
ncbi:MAG: elongation factor P [Candidatus Pacebacteria bacterium]|nr:elongation factor P [Candidatus Paceibacterota bacterium]